MAQCTVEIPYIFVQACVYSCIVYWCLGLEVNAGKLSCPVYVMAVDVAPYLLLLDMLLLVCLLVLSFHVVTFSRCNCTDSNGSLH